MRKFSTCFLALALLVTFAATRSFAQGSGSMGSTGSSAGSMGSMPMGFDFKAASLADIKDADSKFVGLAKAIPAEKYTWRPGDGVRSVAEVFLHLSSANYGLPPMMGATRAEGVNPRELEKSTTDKDKIVDTLSKSFAYLENAVQNASDADLQKHVKMFGGKEGTGGDVLLLIITDLHEHLGQMIAYARVNNVTPPWTAARAQRGQ
jgi:uncharacterized damage-inducible protein DinB